MQFIVETTPASMRRARRQRRLRPRRSRFRQLGRARVNGTLSAIDGLAIAENTMLTGTGVIDGDVSNQGTEPRNIPVRDCPRHQPAIMDQPFRGILARPLFQSIPRSPSVKNCPASSAADSVQGAFDSILLPTGFRGRVIDNQGTLILIAPGSYTQVAQSPNQLRAARALDQWIGIETGDTGEVTLAHRGAIPGSLRSHRPRMVFFCSPSASSKVRPAASSSINNLVPHASLVVPPFAFKGVEPSPIMRRSRAAPGWNEMLNLRPICVISGLLDQPHWPRRRFGGDQNGESGK